MINCPMDTYEKLPLKLKTVEEITQNAQKAQCEDISPSILYKNTFETKVQKRNG